MESNQFRYWAFRIIGIIHMFLAILIFALAVAQFAINLREIENTTSDIDSLVQSTDLGSYYFFVVLDASLFVVFAPLVS